MLLTINERGSKSIETWFSIAICRLLQMTIENPVSNYFSYTFVDSIKVFDCHLSVVIIGKCIVVS